jgi:hypothetical protein
LRLMRRCWRQWTRRLRTHKHMQRPACIARTTHSDPAIRTHCPVLSSLLTLLSLIPPHDEPPSPWAQVTYPATAPELELPELDGKTSKMYRGGKICLTIHFKPLWSKNVPHFGIAHALCLGLGPWMVRSLISSIRS